jgi:hypothetical protein
LASSRPSFLLLTYELCCCSVWVWS